MAAVSKNQQEVADRIIAALDAGTVPWASPYLAGANAPRNLKSRKPYRGINVLLLALSPHAGRYFVTYKQATAMGGQVRQGEKGTRIFFWCPGSRCGSCGRTMPKGFRGNTCHCGQRLPIIQRGYTVFNAESQCDGLSVPAPPKLAPATGGLTLAFRLLDRLAEEGMPTVDEADPAVAYYAPDRDHVNVPRPSALDGGPVTYYGVALHELAHATGHESRLGRELEGAQANRGSYSREELTAELASAFALAELGAEPNIDNSAAYIAGWRSAIADDPTAVTVAAQRASKAVAYLLPTEEAAA